MGHFATHSQRFEPVSIIQIITITQKENQNIEDHSGGEFVLQFTD